MVETIIYTSLELITSSRVLAAGSAHNVLSVVTYQSVSSRLKVYPDRHMQECDARKDYRGFKLTDF